MKHYLKLLTVLSLIFLLSLALTGLVSADILRGKGWLQAEGSGLASLHMTGHVEIKGHGIGVIYIYGAREIQAEGKGHRTNLVDGGVVFRGYYGVINVMGERMTVKMVGDKIDFTARGKGTAHLRGRGHYETANLSGDWNNKGVELEVLEE